MLFYVVLFCLFYFVTLRLPAWCFLFRRMGLISFFMSFSCVSAYLQVVVVVMGHGVSRYKIWITFCHFFCAYFGLDSHDLFRSKPP